MHSLGLLLHDAARLLKREFERKARHHKLSLMQWRVIGQLSRNDGLTQTALGALVEASPMTISDIVDRLESLDLVRRETDPSDSRAKLVWTTSKARDLVVEMREIAKHVYEKALLDVSPADREALSRALLQININLGNVALKDQKDTV